MKCENCGSCLKHPLEEELQWDRADGSEGADLNSLKQTGFLSKKRPDSLSLGPACSVSLSVSLLHSGCWTLRTRRVLHARVEIFKPGGQRSAVCCCQAQAEVDQSLSGRFIYLLMRKCGRLPFSSPFSPSLFFNSASVSQIFCLSVIVNHRCETLSQEVSKRENERARSCTFTFLQPNKTQDLCLSFCLSTGMSQHLR